MTVTVTTTTTMTMTIHYHFSYIELYHHVLNLKFLNVLLDSNSNWTDHWSLVTDNNTDNAD